MKLDFRPRVYMRQRTHTYLFLRDGRSYGYFLTMESGSIEIVKLERQDNQGYQVRDYKGDMWDLVPLLGDFERAIRNYHESKLSRSIKADREIRTILGLELPKEESAGGAEEAQTRAPKDSPSQKGSITLTQLCEGLKIEPGIARKILRGKMEKPGASWSWPNREATTAVVKLLNESR